MPSRECPEEGCHRPVHAYGLCQTHHRQRTGRSKRPRKRPAAPAPPPKRLVPSVAALWAWEDVVRGGPTGQRLALYECPACHGLHLVSWLPIDAHPGLKTSTCRAKSAGGAASIGRPVNVLAPPPSGMLDGPPEGYRPESRERVTVTDLEAARERARVEVEVA